MWARMLKVGQRCLLIWGGLSLAGAVVIVSMAAYQMGPGNRVRKDTASIRDVRFVLNWCRLGEQRIEKVVHSYTSQHGFSGDYLDAYAIKISHVDLIELTKETKSYETRWYRGDELPKVLDDAVDLTGGWGHTLPWFPREEQLRSSEYYVYPWSIHYYGIHPNGVQLIFVRPADKMVFYIGSKS